MIFLLLLGLLIPAYTHTEEKTTAAADELNKRVDACVATYEKALRLTENVNTIMDYDSEHDKMVENLKKNFAEKKPSSKSEQLLAHAIKPNCNMGFPLKDKPGSFFTMPGLDFTKTVFHREALASLYETVYEKTRHKKFYDTDHTVETLFPDPATFKKTSQFHYDHDGKRYRVVLPKTCFPPSTQENFTRYVNNLPEDQWVPYIDRLRAHALYLLADATHEPTIKDGDGIAVVGLIDTKVARKHIGMGIVRERGEESEMIVHISAFGPDIDDIQDSE